MIDFSKGSATVFSLKVRNLVGQILRIWINRVRNWETLRCGDSETILFRFGVETHYA